MSAASNNRAAALAATFKQKAQAARKEIELPVPLANDPDFVFPCVVRRVDIVTLVTSPTAGLPEQFINQVLGTVSPERLAKLQEGAQEAAQEVTAAGVTVEQVINTQRFIRQVAQETCLEPRIVYGPTDDENAINLDDPEFAHCAPEIITALYNYGINLSPGVPVKMANKTEASLESIGNFPANPTLPHPVHDGETIWPAPIEADGNP